MNRQDNIATHDHNMTGIAVLDAGGQYCHLLARRVRECGVQSHILPVDVDPEALTNISGVIISGGPKSVTEPDSPMVQERLFDLSVPILGICYGHQLIAARRPGGSVRKSAVREYGIAKLRLREPNVNSVLSDVKDGSRVWMSHGDSVIKPPTGFEVLASTDDCAVAVMADPEQRIFGLQFHPEVTHSEYGHQILRNFIVNICRCRTNWHPSSLETIAELEDDIRTMVGPIRKVLFFVSGGVDSTVAYKLCSNALGPNRVRGVYVDTGFMRENETESVILSYQAAGLNVEVSNRSTDFLRAVEGIADPETKRKAIGLQFLAVENAVLEDLPASEWMLGQGTIYPDTIESGGTRDAALIKTHHNRVPELMRRIEKGEVVEPLVQFYKDEVRQIGKALRLPTALVDKHPFPGPGLAVRYLCSREVAGWKVIPALVDVAATYGFWARALPLRAVGVQGDERTYAYVGILDGSYSIDTVSSASRAITNSVADVNRVAFWLGGKGQMDEYCVERRFIDEKGLGVLRKADAICQAFFADSRVRDRIWQCPVVFVPLTRQGDVTIAVRPIESSDGMTAQYVKLKWHELSDLRDRLLSIPGVGAVLYDVSNKPPATIEWE